MSTGDQPRPQPKQDLHPRKVLLNVWCDMFAVINFETLAPNQTITSQSYCYQLDKLNERLKEKRTSLINCKSVMEMENNTLCVRHSKQTSNIFSLLGVLTSITLA